MTNTQTAEMVCLGVSFIVVGLLLWFFHEDDRMTRRDREERSRGR